MTWGDEQGGSFHPDRLGGWFVPFSSLKILLFSLCQKEKKKSQYFKPYRFFISKSAVTGVFTNWVGSNKEL